MIDHATELYKSAVNKIGVFKQGEFIVSQPNSTPVGNVEIRDITPPIDPEIYTVYPPKIAIKWKPLDKTPVVYTLDPSNLSEIERKELVDSRSWWQKLRRKKQRTTADSEDIEELAFILTGKPTESFAHNIADHERQIKIDRDRLDREIREQREERMRQQKMQEDEVKAMNKAAAMLSEVKSLGNSFYLGIIVDDKEKKSTEIISSHQNVEKSLIYKPVLQWIEDSGEAFRILVAIQRLNSVDNHVPVVVFMDGQLRGDYASGIQLLVAVRDLIKKDGLILPKIIGCSGDPKRNKEMQQIFPHEYITSFQGESLEHEPFREIETAIRTTVEKYNLFSTISDRFQ